MTQPNDSLHDLPDDLLTRRATARAGAAPLPCPGDDELSAWVEHRLPEPAEAAIEDHLAACRECRSASEILRADLVAVPAEVPRAGAARGTRLRLGSLAAAAALLLGLTGYLVLGGRGGDSPTPLGREAVLEAAARDLAAAEPALFGDFQLLSAAELEAQQERVTRGGIEVYAPRENLLTGRPRCAWKRVPGASTYALTVIDANGRAVLRATSATDTWTPPAEQAELTPGDYVVKVSASDGIATTDGSQAFHVLPTEARDLWRKKLEALRAHAPKSEAPLLRVHLALRAGLLDEVEDALLEQLSATPDPPNVAALLRHLMARRGDEGRP